MKYLGGIAKNRKVTIKKEDNAETIRVDNLAESLSNQASTEIELKVDKPLTLWVTTLEVGVSRLEGKRSIAIVMNAPTFNQATDVDYFITNVDPNIVTPEWIVKTYSQRNWLRSILSGKIARL